MYWHINYSDDIYKILPKVTHIMKYEVTEFRTGFSCGVVWIVIFGVLLTYFDGNKVKRYIFTFVRLHTISKSKIAALNYLVNNINTNNTEQWYRIRNPDEFERHCYLVSAEHFTYMYIQWWHSLRDKSKSITWKRQWNYMDPKYRRGKGTMTHYTMAHELAPDQHHC